MRTMGLLGVVCCAVPFATIVAAQCPPDQVILNGPSLGNGVNVGSTPREIVRIGLRNDGAH